MGGNTHEIPSSCPHWVDSSEFLKLVYLVVLVGVIDVDLVAPFEERRVLLDSSGDVKLARSQETAASQSRGGRKDVSMVNSGAMGCGWDE